VGDPRLDLVQEYSSQALSSHEAGQSVSAASLHAALGAQKTESVRLIMQLQSEHASEVRRLQRQVEGRDQQLTGLAEVERQAMRTEHDMLLSRAEDANERAAQAEAAVTKAQRRIYELQQKLEELSADEAARAVLGSTAALVNTLRSAASDMAKQSRAIQTRCSTPSPPTPVWPPPFSSGAIPTQGGESRAGQGTPLSGSSHPPPKTPSAAEYVTETGDMSAYALAASALAAVDVPPPASVDEGGLLQLLTSAAEALTVCQQHTKDIMQHAQADVAGVAAVHAQARSAVAAAAKARRALALRDAAQDDAVAAAKQAAAQAQQTKKAAQQQVLELRAELSAAQEAAGTAAEGLQAEVAAAEAETAAANRRAAEDAQQTHREIVHMQEQVAAAQRQAAAAEAAATEAADPARTQGLQTELASLHKQLQWAHSTASVHKAEQEAWASTEAELVARVQQMQEAVAARQADLAAARAEVTALRQEVSTAHADTAAARREVRKAREAAGQSEGSIPDRMQQLQGQLEAERSRCDQLQGQLDQATRTAHTLLQSADTETDATRGGLTDSLEAATEALQGTSRRAVELQSSNAALRGELAALQAREEDWGGRWEDREQEWRDTWKQREEAWRQRDASWVAKLQAATAAAGDTLPCQAADASWGEGGGSEALELAQAQLRSQQTARGKLQDQLAAVSHQLDEANARVGALSKERLQLLDAAAANAHDGQHSAQRVQTLSRELAQTQQQLQAAHRELEAAQAAPPAAPSPGRTAVIARLQEQLDATQAQLRSTQEQLQVQRERVQKLVLEGDGLRHSAAAAETAREAAQRGAATAKEREASMRQQLQALLVEQQELLAATEALQGQADAAASAAAGGGDEPSLQELKLHLRNERGVTDALREEVQRLGDLLHVADATAGAKRPGAARKGPLGGSMGGRAAASARSADRARRQADAVRISNLQSTVDRLQKELASAKRAASVQGGRRRQQRQGCAGGGAGGASNARAQAGNSRGRLHREEDEAVSPDAPPTPHRPRTPSAATPASMDAAKRFDHMHHSNAPAAGSNTPSAASSRAGSRGPSRSPSPVVVSNRGHASEADPPYPAGSPSGGHLGQGMPAAQPLPPGAQLYKDENGNTFLALQSVPVASVSAPASHLSQQQLSSVFTAFAAVPSAGGSHSPPLRAPTRPPLKATPSSAHTGRTLDAQGAAVAPRGRRATAPSASSTPQRGKTTSPNSPPPSGRVSWQPLSRTVEQMSSPSGAFVPPPSAGGAPPPGMRGAALNGGISRARNPGTPHKLKWNTPTPVPTEEALRAAYSLGR